MFTTKTSSRNQLTDKTCSAIIKVKEISLIMAYDNLSFIQARKVFENKDKSSTSVPFFSKANFRLKNFKLSKSTFTDTATQKAIKQFTELITSIPDPEKFWPRIWKTMELYVWQSHTPTSS